MGNMGPLRVEPEEDASLAARVFQGSNLRAHILLAEEARNRFAVLAERLRKMGPLRFELRSDAPHAPRIPNYPTAPRADGRLSGG